MVIVYQSHTGFTKEYAQMLGKAEKIKTYTLDEAAHQLLSGTQIFYMGPLTAGHIGGLDRAMKRYQVQGVCGVGIPASIQNLLNVTGMTILNNFTSAYGSDPVAAMGIAQRVNIVPFQIAMGFSQAV